MVKQNLKVITSWDDGGVNDYYIADTLLEFNLPGTFYIQNDCDITKEQIKKLSENFEIGGHTVRHFSNLRLLSDEILKYEIEENKKWLEEIIGKTITKFCYPRGRYDDRVIKYVKSAGFTEARNTLILKTITEDPFRSPTTIHICPIRTEYKEVPWIDIARKWAIKAANDNGFFHIWGHSKEINRYGEWENFRKICQWLKDNFIII
jgi:peptidoglycan-N-acetylglucosamine deacetylase